MADRVTLRELRYFLVVADTGSFTRAAADLHVSQPALTGAIQQLERRLGVRLLIRGSRPLTLTAAGRVLHEDSQALLAAADRAVERVARVGTGAEGDIVVASTQSLSVGFIPELMLRLGERLPRPVIRHRLGWVSEVVGLVRSGAVTAAFMRYAPAPDNDLARATLGHESVVACLGRSHRLAQAARVGLGELRDERWAVMDPAMSPRWHEVFLASCEAQGFHPLIGELVSVADLSAAHPTFARIAAGELVSYVGVSLVAALSAFGVRCVALDDSLPPLPIDAVWRVEDLLAASVVETARDICAAPPWEDEISRVHQQN